MTCNDLHILIEDFVDGLLEEDEANAIQEHIAYCEHCRIQKNAYATYREQMRTFKGPTFEPGHAAKILQRARRLGEQQQQKTQHRQNHSFIYGFAAASVLAFAIMIGGDFFTTEKSSTAIVGVIDWEQEISLVIRVPNDMNNATLVLNLPPDISIQGLEHLSEIEWMVNLKKGNNTITLPIKIEPYASYVEKIQLAASIIYKNDKKDFALNLNLTSPRNNDTKKS